MTHQVFIIGAGPVGLLTANLLGQLGHRVQVFDKKSSPSPGSNAIGITPPSLHVLKTLGLDQDFIRKGVPIRKVKVYGKRSLLGTVSFSELRDDFPFILSLPQPTTEKLLLENLKKFPLVTINYGLEFESFNQEDLSVTCQFKDLPPQVCDILIGCDGGKSLVRKGLGSKDFFSAYKPTFLMGDFKDQTNFGEEARLFFTPMGAVEAFPLPDGRRRWIVQTPKFLENPGDYLIDQVKVRTGVVLKISDQTWESSFGMQRMHASTHGRGRVFLAGDALHLMSPIGGQGMNTGFADAAALVKLIVKSDGPLSPLSLETLRKSRLRAAKAAATRSALSMAIGTQKGFLSPLRNIFLKILLNGPWKSLIPPHYAMLTIPKDQ